MNYMYLTLSDSKTIECGLGMEVLRKNKTNIYNYYQYNLR